MKRIKLIPTITSLIIAASSAASAVADEPGFLDPLPQQTVNESRQEKLLNRLASLLELTEEQLVSIDMLNETFNEQINTLRQSMRENRAILETLAEAVSVDSNAIQQVADAQGDLFSDLVILKTEKHIAFATILTQEQLEKFEELNATVKAGRNAVSEEEAIGTFN